MGLWSMQLEWRFHIDGLVQERRNSIANAMELRLSCTNQYINDRNYYAPRINALPHDVGESSWLKSWTIVLFCQQLLRITQKIYMFHIIGPMWMESIVDLWIFLTKKL